MRKPSGSASEVVQDRPNLVITLSTSKSGPKLCFKTPHSKLVDERSTFCFTCVGSPFQALRWPDISHWILPKADVGQQ